MTAAGSFSLTTAQWMIDWVHRDATVVRSKTQPAVSARFTDDDIFVIEISHLSDRCPAILVHHSDFAGRHAELCVAFVESDDLDHGSGASPEFSAAAQPHLNGMDGRAGRNLVEWKRISNLNIRGRGGHNRVANL